MLHPDEDLYGTLQVSPRASTEVIQAAYRAIMKPYEGKTDPRSKEIIGRLYHAYGTLSDPSKRQLYDYERLNLTGKIIGAYRLLEPIAEGGFGRTYKGEHVEAKRPVCIKHCSNVSPTHHDILRQEAQAMWDLRHYSIPAVRDLLILDDGSIALVMSYIPGPTLAQVVEKTGCLDAESVAWIAERTLNALQYMHFHGVVHGDIKPQNVIVQPKEHKVTIVDFGLSLVKPTLGSNNKGYTPEFAPPEALAQKVLLPESDFYSLGMTMIYALSGSMENVAQKRVLKDTPDALCDFIRKLIATDVLARPNWEREDLCDTIQEVRKKAFGRSRSGMKPIPGFEGE